MNSITKEKNHPAEIARTMRLATPVIIGQLAVFSMNFIDTVMAGRLPEMEIALSALGIGGAVWSSMLMFILGTLMVVQPSVAQLDGAPDEIRGGIPDPAGVLDRAGARRALCPGSAGSASRCSRRSVSTR